MANPEALKALSEEEQRVAVKMMAYAFEQQLDPMILVKALVVDNLENKTWRGVAAKEENMSEEQIQKIGLALMNMWNFQMSDIVAGNPAQN